MAAFGSPIPGTSGGSVVPGGGNTFVRRQNALIMGSETDLLRKARNRRWSYTVPRIQRQLTVFHGIDLDRVRTMGATDLAKISVTTDPELVND